MGSLGWIIAGLGGAMNSLSAAVMLLVGISILATRPTQAPLYLLALVAFNRWVRRITDWNVGEFSQTPLTSIVPELFCLILLLFVFGQWKSIPRQLRIGTCLIAGAVGLALGVGITNGIGAIFEALTWSAPLGLFLFLVWLRPDISTIVSWFRGMVVIAIICVAYGWYQWLVLPPWEAFWVIESDMASMGAPEPRRSRFYSTFSGPGRVQQFAGLALLLMLVDKRVRPGGNALWLAITAFLMSGILMGRVRSVWLTLMMASLIYMAVTRFSEKIRLVIVTTLVVIAGFVALPVIPGGAAVVDRLDSLTNLAEDGSFNGRVEFSQRAIGMIISRPYGFGMGASGLAGRLAGRQSLIAFDNGYLQIGFALGLPGAALLILGFYKIGKYIWAGLRQDWVRGDPDLNLKMMMAAFVVGHLAQLAASNFLRTEMALLVWLMLGTLAGMVYRKQTMPQRRPVELPRQRLTPRLSPMPVPARPSTLRRRP